MLQVVADIMRSSYKSGKSGIFFHAKFMADLGDLSRLMRKSNILAEQVAWVMEEDREVAAAWQGRVSQRWVEPALRLLESVGHNVQSSVKVLSDKASDVGAKIDTCKKRKRGAEGGGQQGTGRKEAGAGTV